MQFRDLRPGDPDVGRRQRVTPDVRAGRVSHVWLDEVRAHEQTAVQSPTKNRTQVDIQPGCADEDQDPRRGLRLCESHGAVAEAVRITQTDTMANSCAWGNALQAVSESSARTGHGRLLQPRLPLRRRPGLGRGSRETRVPVWGDPEPRAQTKNRLNIAAPFLLTASAGLAIRKTMEVYDVVKDPREETSVVGQCPEEEEAARQRIAAWVQGRIKFTRGLASRK